LPLLISAASPECPSKIDKKTPSDGDYETGNGTEQVMPRQQSGRQPIDSQIYGQISHADQAEFNELFAQFDIMLSQFKT